VHHARVRGGDGRAPSSPSDGTNAEIDDHFHGLAPAALVSSCSADTTKPGDKTPGLKIEFVVASLHAGAGAFDKWDLPLGPGILRRGFNGVSAGEHRPHRLGRSVNPSDVGAGTRTRQRAPAPEPGSVIIVASENDIVNNRTDGCWRN